MSKYKELSKLPTEYARRMNYLSNRIFGEVARPTNSKSMKVVKMFSAQPVQKNDYFVNYYPRHVETGWLMRHLRSYGLFRDEHEDFKEEMKRLRALRGAQYGCELLFRKTRILTFSQFYSFRKGTTSKRRRQATEEMNVLESVKCRIKDLFDK